ncbi:MAG: sodium:proton antiporter [Deltaproteobacteria bacterium]|jgi:Na+/H+ antiporter NhaD/arsenite permease-like protein|nr:sodium:proton antiporter [Deltaproteobacteria bacterium]
MFSSLSGILRARRAWLAVALSIVLLGAGNSLSFAATDAAVAAIEASSLHLDGRALSFFWVLPFVGTLLSIALLPLFASRFWDEHFGKIALFWSLAFLVPFFLAFGSAPAFYVTLHTLIEEYVPFIILLLALFTIAGGVSVTGSLSGTPLLNLGFLGAGAILASVMGTTGASMLLIRPLIRAISHRRHKTHSVIFFIFIVANAGGCLTPLGDPPLFLGFLKGVDFFWTLVHLWPQTLFLCASLLAIHYVIDAYYFRKEGKPRPESPSKISLEGKRNFLLLAGVVALVLYSGLYPSEGAIPVWADIEIAYSNLARDLGLLALTFLSVWITDKGARRANYFTWRPIMEVAKLFGGIFVTMIPAIAILRAGSQGALRSLISLVSGPDGAPVNAAYFWLTGALSSFLDNAPTYLVFFNTAGGDAATLMSLFPLTLSAVSCGAVFMGANTYIGNAPNFMVRSIAAERGIQMPSFFGYMAWSGAVLIPLFIAMTFLFYARF